MNDAKRTGSWATEEGVQEDLEHQPHILLRLAENALTVAESLRDNYFKNTARFVEDLRKAMERSDPLISVTQVSARIGLTFRVRSSRSLMAELDKLRFLASFRSLFASVRTP